ncbi:hypothetical protein SADUNF_Sadunf08G0044800 [Salix dunnii]|uniref:Uncharacterized protein n=1 Tax=Salix dunnii TaxID=1413687 RepID=A0A835MS29_9ROSI|nr:hypothetical protein SADUNF_Sadunf08G0044800 [Salix dunnii]
MGDDYKERGRKWDLQQNPLGFGDTKDDEAATQRVRLWFLSSLSIFFSFFNHSLFLGFSTMTSL